VRCRRLRRQSGALTAIAVISLVLIAGMPAAGATVINPGTTAALGNVSLRTTALATDDLHQIGVLATGTVASDGTWTIPFANIAFGFTDLVVHAPGEQLDGVTLHVTLAPTSDFAGDVQPDIHSASLFGNASLLISADGMFTNCTVGPFALNMQTVQTGGAAYDETTGTATLVDGLVSLPAVSRVSPGCGGWDNRINRALALPTVAGSSTIGLSVTLTPPPLSSPLGTTTTTTTTTTMPPTSTTPTSDTTTTGSSPATQGDTTTATAGATTTGASAGSTSTARSTPKPAAAAKPNTKSKSNASTTTKPPRSTTTTAPLRDNRGEVVTPLPLPSVPPTDAPKPDAIRIPDDAQPVSRRLPSGVLIFGISLLLGGIGVSLIGTEIRKFVQPRHRPRLH
jgi:hypothetical protein